MRKPDKSDPEVLVTSTNQLVPTPDAYGIQTKMGALPERDKIDKMLRSYPLGCFGVICKEKDVFLPSRASDKTNGMIASAKFPEVIIRLYDNKVFSQRRISPDDEKMFVAFLKKLCFDEVTTQPTNPYDRIERRLFSLPRIEI